ncbi:hypothetical protein [Mucilaginibacter sp. CSA2-8R]|uniref:hypothetical protein n=1 Tax=Mucilaginibacter sp. CSA2-8R TaxID=3141542 RepID=UPI00315DCD66
MVVKSVERGVATLVGIMLFTGGLAYGIGCWNTERVHTLSSGPCRIQFNYRIDVDSLDEGYELANRKLAQCLCRAYDAGVNQVDTARIRHLYKKFGTPLSYLNISADTRHLLDSLVKHHLEVFDTLETTIR